MDLLVPGGKYTLRPRPAFIVSTLLVSISCNDPNGVTTFSNLVNVSSIRMKAEG